MILCNLGLNAKATRGGAVGRHQPQRDAGLERGDLMPGQAHRLDVLRLVIKQLAQLHCHRFLSAAPAPVKACHTISLAGNRDTSGCSSTSALGVRCSHPQLGSPLGGPAPLLGRLRLRMRSPSGGCNWPGGDGAPSSHVQPSSAPGTVPGAKFPSLAPPGPKASRDLGVCRPRAGDGCSFRSAAAQWKSLPGSLSAMRRRKRCRGCAGRAESEL